MTELQNADGYTALLHEVVDDIASTRQRAVEGANAELIALYWRIGGHLDESRGYGTGYIDSLAHDIRLAFPGIKGFSSRSLRYMTKFARETSPEFCNVCCKIPWGHIVQLLDKTEPGPMREWYVQACIENGWSRSVLMHQIELQLYERQALSGMVSNFSRTLPPAQSELAQQQLKDPYIFDFVTARQNTTERDIEDAMVSNITALLLELGTGFAFLGRQYHIVAGGEDFYLDLLFYNTRLRSYVVVELKNADFEPEYVGKLNFYLSAVDECLRGEFDNPSIGLLLCKEKNDVVAEWSLRDVGKPMGVSEYRLASELPEELTELLPSANDLRCRILPQRDASAADDEEGDGL